MNNTLPIVLIVLLSMFAWLAWQKPAAAPTPPMVRVQIPVPAQTDATDKQQQYADKTQEKWRVITRRVMSEDGIRAIESRLRSLKLAPLKFSHQEEMVMHAFDDATLFKSMHEANKAATYWRENGIKATVIRADEADVYLVGLGRFYQQKYAESMQTRLDKLERKYRYQQRSVPIPAWRYTFIAMNKVEIEAQWSKLEASGVMMPVMMPEKRFQELYGKAKLRALN